MKVKRIHILLVSFGLALCVFPFRNQLIRPAASIISITKGRKTVTDRVAQFGPTVRARLADDFKRIGCSYPPVKMILVGLKKEKRLEVWVASTNGVYLLMKTYPILAASGQLGPKLLEGDGQVPEGIYQIESLNPNSMFHLSLRVNYPNAFDRKMGAIDKRELLGNDIMIHGSFCSAGCLAMGDPAAEELFIMAAESGLSNVIVILSPVDFRVCELPINMPSVPTWTPKLYAAIRQELDKLKHVPPRKK